MSSNDEIHYLSGKTIVVIGAGIGGLTFSIAFEQILRQINGKIDPPPQLIVYERDPSIDVIGREGYSLSIRGDQLSGGMQIFQKLSILDQMIEESNPGSHFTLFNNDFTPLMEIRSPPVEGLPQSSIRIARLKLRQILLKNIPSSIPIHWNCAVKSAKELENGKVLIGLSNGSEEECDLLIVADGANSLIRRLLRPEHELHFAGAVTIAARTHHLEKLPSPLDKTWGGAIGGDGHFLFVAPNDQTSALWSVSYLSSTPRQVKSAGTINENEIDQILSEAKERTKVFGELMITLLKETSRSSISVFNANDLTPFHNHGSVIFIGDAQHAMSPFAGNGANMAIMDAYQLAQQLFHSNDLPTAIQSYDQMSIPRSTSAIQMSHRSISIGHSQGIWKFLWVNVLRMMAWYFGFNYKHDQQSN